MVLPPPIQPLLLPPAVPLTNIRLGICDGVASPLRCWEQARVPFERVYSLEIKPWAIAILEQLWPAMVHLGALGEFQDQAPDWLQQLQILFPDIALFLDVTIPCVNHLPSAGDQYGWMGAQCSLVFVVRQIVDVLAKHLRINDRINLCGHF